MSSKSKSQLRTENSTNFPNNNTQFITPERLRGFNNDMIDSLVVSSDSGSFITTSSFDNSTRNLTFTKGDGSTYTNNIPGGGTAETGSLLTTASVSDATITFTKGDASQFSIEVNNVSASIQAEDLVITVKNTSGVTLPAGTAVKATGVTGENITIVSASADNPSLMPAIGVLNQEIANNATGECYIAGRLENINTSNLVAGAAVYVNNNGGLTATKPTGSDLIQNIGIAAKINATEGELVIQGSGRSNDLPNITEGYLWVGDSNGVPEAISTGSFIKESETGSFARTDVANTFTAGPQIVSGTNGFVTQTFDIPGSNQEKKLIDVKGANIDGAAYNRVFAGFADYPSFGDAYKDYFSIEYYNSTAYTFGSELSLNGVITTLSTIPSGSGATNVARIRTQDNQDGTSTLDQRGNTINIGTSGNNQTINIGKSSTNGSIAGNFTFDTGYTTTINGNVNATGLISSSNAISASQFVGGGTGLTDVAVLSKSNTFTTGPQIVSGSSSNTYFQSSFGQPSNSQILFFKAPDANVGGTAYPLTQFGYANYLGFGNEYSSSLLFEANRAGYTGGAELGISGKEVFIQMRSVGEAFGQRARFRIRDIDTGASEARLDANDIYIGTGANTSNVTLGSSFITIDTAALISSSNAISASEFIGDGSKLSGVAGGIFVQTGSYYSTTNDLQVTGSFDVNGGIGGNNVDLTISSQTASLDLRTSNTFTLELVGGTDTHLSVSNFSGNAQSVNILVKQPVSSQGTISFSSDFKFGQGANAAEDIISFTRFSNSLYGTFINNFS